jgi:hypothetical protein
MQADSAGTFRFRPVGRSHFAMTEFDPLRWWTWTGGAMGVPIDYWHRVRTGLADGDPAGVDGPQPRTGRRSARLFALVYTRPARPGHPTIRRVAVAASGPTAPTRLRRSLKAEFHERLRVPLMAALVDEGCVWSSWDAEEHFHVVAETKPAGWSGERDGLGVRGYGEADSTHFN